MVTSFTKFHGGSGGAGGEEAAAEHDDGGVALCVNGAYYFYKFTEFIEAGVMYILHTHVHVQNKTP